jgi:uncharacterized protein YggE
LISRPKEYAAARLDEDELVTQHFRWLFFAILALAAAVLATTLPADAQTPVPGQDRPVVVTSGEGVIQAVPDRAYVTISAESRAASPREAQRRNTEMMKPVQDKLRAAGIPADAIRTTAYDLQFEYDWNNGRRIPKGYVARNTIEVRVDAIDRLGELLDLAVTAGATSVSDIRFDVKDRARLERDAIRMAVADARAKADAAAAGAGSSIDRVVRIEEHGVVSPPPMPMMRMAMKEQSQAADVPIATGQLELRARVTLTATLK